MANTDMLHQMKESVKKFIGRAVISDENNKEPVVKTENTYVTKEDLALVMKNFRGRTHSKSQGDQPERKNKSTNYKGRKNPLGKDFKPL